MLRKQHRLTKRRDFKRIFTSGQTYVHKLFILKIMYTDTNQASRFGFSASSKLGNAVIRNRIKRILRESIRLLDKSIKQSGYDAVIIARSSIRECDSVSVSKAVADIFKKTGILIPADQAHSKPLE